MKRCPECGREYDLSMSFCLDDGAELLYGPASASGDGPPQTPILYENEPAGEAVTRAQIDTTEQTAILSQGVEAEPRGRLGGLSERQSLSAPRAAKPLILAAVGLAILVGGFFGYRYLKLANGGAINSIAVLPFQNKSGDPNSEYLSDGLAESLIYRLTQLPNLKVSPTSAVIRYKGKDTDVAKIASELGVDAVMTGRMAQIGDNLTISVELVDVRNNTLLWGEQYDRKMTDLLATQREMATTIAEKLRLKLSGDDTKGLAKRYTENNEAYQFYLKGRFYGAKRTASDAQKSIESYQQAIAIDPKFALAFAGLAEANWFLALYSYPQIPEAVPKARELALKAIDLDGSLAEPHSVLGVICNSNDRDFVCGEREQKRAIELNPNYSEGHRRVGLLLMNLGRFDEARVATRRALEIDPLAPVTNQQYAQLLFYEGKYEESEALSKKNIELDPNFWYAHWQLFMVYRHKRDFPMAVEALVKVQESRGEPESAKFIRESFSDGDWTGFLKKITADRTRLKLYPFFVATFFAELGEKDKAFAALNEAIETKDQHTGQMNVDPFMDPLRDDPRFKVVVKKAGFPE
jgi:adenylate cyclase